MQRPLLDEGGIAVAEIAELTGNMLRQLSETIVPWRKRLGKNGTGPAREARRSAHRDAAK